MLIKSTRLRYFTGIILFSILASCSNRNFVENQNEIIEANNPETYDYCPNNEPLEYSDYDHVWSDTFNTLSLDINNWNYIEHYF